MSGKEIMVRRRPAIWGAAVSLYVVGIFSFLMLAPLSTQGQQFACFTKDGCTKAPPAGAGGDFDPGHGCSGAEGYCYAKPAPTELTVQIGKNATVTDIGDYIQRVYQYALGAAAVIAAVMMMIGGFQYVTAGGDQSRVSQGKQRITDAVVGLFLVISAYLILNTINPDLVKLQLPRIPMIRRQEYTGCANTEMCHPCGVKYGVKLNARGAPPKQGECVLTTTDLNAGGVVAQCVGKGCKAAGCATDAGVRCTAAEGPEDKSECAAAGGGSGGPSGSTGYVCKACTPDGAACSPSGANDKCCGGFCGGSTCTAGQPGDVCNENAGCATGICQTNWGNSCSTGETGSPCASASECKPGFKCNTSGNNVCTPGTKYSICFSDSECQSDLKCLKLTGLLGVPSGHTFVCMPPDTTELKSCETNTDCGAGELCNTRDRNFCTDGSAGAPCSDSGECGEKAPKCVGGICTSGQPGSKCENNQDCVPGRCFTGGDFAVCVTGKIGSRCDDTTDCDQNLKCQDNRCLQ